MERELILKFNIDRTRATQAAQAYVAEEKQRIAQVLTTAQLVEAARTAVITRENQRRIAQEVSWQEAVKGGTARGLNDLEVAEKAKAALIERTNKQKIDAAVRAEIGEEQVLTKLLTKEQAVFQARNALIAKHNRDRVDAELKAMDASQQGWSGTEAAITGAMKSLGSFSLQMVGLGSIQSVIGTIADNFERAKREAMEAVKFTQGYREALLELAALKGQMGQTTKTLTEDVAFRAKTLQSAADSRAFQLAALGAGESAIGVNIGREQFQRAMELGGQFQSTEQGAATTHGTLIGMIPTLMGKKGITGEEAFAKEQQLFRIFQPGGGSFSQMTNQFLQQAPLVTSGIYRDPADMAALLSAFSTTNKEGAGTNVQQFTRATVGGLGRMRGASIEGSVEKQAQFLKRIGATDQMDPTQIGKLISGEFTKEEGLAAGRGETFNPMTYMQKHGYMNQEDIMAVMAFHGMMKSGQFEGTFEKRAGELPTVKEALKPIEERQKVDPVFAGRRAEIAEEAGQLKKAAGLEETLSPILRTAFAKLSGNKQIVGEFADVMTRTDWNPHEFMYGYRNKVEMEAQQTLVKEAERLGIDAKVPQVLRQTATGMQSDPQFMGREKLFELAQKVEAAGGNTQAGFQADVASAVKKLDQSATNLSAAADKLDKALGPKNPPIPGRPVVQTR